MEPFFIDANIVQDFAEVGLSRELTLMAQNLNLGLTITQTCSKEIDDSNNISRVEYIRGEINSGSIKMVYETACFTGRGRGEKSILNQIKIQGLSTSAVSVGTTDQGATRTFSNESIRTFDRVEILLIMTYRGIISITRAIQVYTQWTPLRKHGKVGFFVLYINYEVHILKKLGIVGLLTT